MPPRFLTERLLPAAIFIPLSVAVASFIFGRYIPESNLSTKFAAQCNASHPSSDGQTPFLPYSVTYTGFPVIDGPLCSYVTFFHAVMGPSSLPFTIDLLVSLSTYAIIPYFEAARNGRSPLLTVPLLVGLLYQYWTIAIIYPLYWFFFLWSGGGSLHKNPGGEHTKIDQAHAEAILFSVFIGFFIPTAAMFVLDDPYVTAIWQAFPLLMTLSQWAHRLGRPSSQYPYSGYPTVRATYIILFVIGSSYHISIAWPKFRDVALLKQLYVPELPLPDMTLESGALGFLKWDGFFGTLAVVLASLWFARSVKELFALIAWYAVTIVTIGPGASLASVFLWRESILNAMRPAEETDSKTTKKER